MSIGTMISKKIRLNTGDMVLNGDMMQRSCLSDNASAMHEEAYDKDVNLA